MVLIRPQRHHPDMTYTIGAGFVFNNHVIPGQFRYDERRSEERWFHEWFREAGYHIHQLPAGLTYEGAGDTGIEPHSQQIWFGYRQRSQQAVQHWLEHLLRPLIGLNLIDERFFHLDTCFNFLSNGELIYYPAAFDRASQKRIEHEIAAERRIIVNERDALQFSCNALIIHNTIITHSISEQLEQTLKERGYEVI